jgi:S1-C subfamily serine protease
MTIVFAALLALSSSAQDKSDDRTKRILDRVEKEIQDSHKKLLEDIRQIVRAELGKDGARTTPPSESKKAYLGINLDDLTDDDRKALGITDGVKIGEARGPAANAGLKPGDIVLELDGEVVTEERLPDILGRHKPGDTITVTFLRGKKRDSLKLVLGGR